MQISNVSGDITVTGWNKLEVEVSGELGKNSELLFERNGRRTSVKVVKKNNSRNVQPTNLIVSVPQGSELTVNGVSSDIEVKNVRGVQRLEAVSGDITSEVFESDVETKTVSGDVSIVGHGGSSLLTVTSLSGDTDIMQIAGELEASTVSGEIDVRAGSLSRARLKATNGDITIVADLAADGRFEGQTINGNIKIELEDGSDLNVDIETFNGDIENCFGLKNERKSKYAPGKMLRFNRGAGNRNVRVKTMNGDVEICSKRGR